jgi:FkbH-like protein
MKNNVNLEEVIKSYLQSDSSSESSDFKAFSDAIKILSRKEGRANIAKLVSRAISPHLDYSSLRALRKYLKSDSKSDALRILVVGGSTLSQLVELLEVFLVGAGISAVIRSGEYGLFRQELLAPNDVVDAFRPQIVFIATSACDVARRPSLLGDQFEVSSLLQAEISDWQRLWIRANKRWGATIIQNTFEVTPYDPFGHFSIRHPSSSSTWLRKLNASMTENAPGYVVFHDLNHLVFEYGAKEWFDPRFYLEAKMPCGPECLVGYAHSIMSLIRGIAGKSKKVLVLDLDNTIWGGTVGDLGPGGIQLGQGSAEGEAFLAFQHYAKSLHDRGVLLAVCSKNDDLKAREPFQKRSDMVLQLSDISCFIANWQDKAQNLREIAKTLSLGIDSLVFVDDNPAERALVRRLLPEVSVPELPEDPSGYIQALAKHRYFETISFTKEDALRTEYYKNNAKRDMLASQSDDLNSFLISLDMKANISPVNSINLERVTQLINKSNQFNLTTYRYTHPEVEAIANNPNYRTLAISLKDTLGDNGLISVIFLKKDGPVLLIELWLMSCRVLLRGVEQIAINQIVSIANSLNCETIVGKYIPTEKNNMVSDLYSTLGFQFNEKIKNISFWSLKVDSFTPLKTHINL